MAAQTKRDQIVALKLAGCNNHEIVNQLTVCRKTVFNIWERYQEKPSTLPNIIPGRNPPVCTKRNIEVVNKRMKRNLRRSIRKMAKELDISDRSLRRIVKYD